MTDRSKWAKDCRIRAVLAQALKHLRRGHIVRLSVAVVGRHAVKAGCQPSEYAVGGKR
jgi:hypothetical protein